MGWKDSGGRLAGLKEGIALCQVFVKIAKETKLALGVSPEHSVGPLTETSGRCKGRQNLLGGSGQEKVGTKPLWEQNLLSSQMLPP